MSETRLKIVRDSDELAALLATRFLNYVRDLLAKKNDAFIALSGGSTPLKFYRQTAALPEAAAIDWTKVSFFWSDDRCVPPDHADSNFGLANRELFVPLGIAGERVFRMKGEADPEEAVMEYRELLTVKVPQRHGLPYFDLVFLGMGDDGHTASIFPDQLTLWDSEELCEIAVHPVTSQKRITFTGQVINNAAMVSIVVTGRAKRERIHRIMNRAEGFQDYPVARVRPEPGILEWWLDREAAGDLH
ncbi:MAG: 6-phosphogluconolactonase [Bacteroidota bacterium]